MTSSRAARTRRPQSIRIAIAPSRLEVPWPGPDDFHLVELDKCTVLVAAAEVALGLHAPVVLAVGGGQLDADPRSGSELGDADVADDA